MTISPRTRFAVWAALVVGYGASILVWLCAIRGDRILNHDARLITGWIVAGLFVGAIAILVRNAPTDSIKLSSRSSLVLIIGVMFVTHLLAILLLWPALSEDTIRYRVDGKTWINTPIAFAGTAAAVRTNSSSANTVSGVYIQFTGGSWFDQITADFSAIAAANNNPNFGVRMVNASTGADNVNGTGTAYNNSSGNWRFDNVAITGTAVPEPASVSLLALGALGLSVRRRAGR